MGVTNRCQTARAVRMPPRPATLPWNVLVVQSDPPIVDEDDVEEFLVHDPLFVEFFNAFLSLPSFPEPICFNVETGGFEVVSDAKRRLAQQIKEAVRSQNLTAKMYRVVRHHAFSNIPLIPIEDTIQGPEAVKIDTSFEVTALNKDQGIYWIKAERLPIFLESDYYFQYRLAKVISQARIFNDKGEFIIMKIDFTRRPKKKKVSVEVPPPNLEDIIMKEMFVSFGDVRGAAKEDWFNLAKAELRTDPPFTPIGVKVPGSGGTPGTSKAAVTDTVPAISRSVGGLNVSPSVDATKPPAAETIKSLKKSSVFHSHFFGVYAPGLIGPADADPPIVDHAGVAKHVEETAPKPFTPRPSEHMFKSTDMVRKKVTPGPRADEYMATSGPAVYVRPKVDLSNVDAESGIAEMEEQEEEFEKRMNEQPIIDQIYHDGSWEGEGATIALRNMDELGSVIVGAVMKKTVANMLGVDENKVVADPSIAGIYPSQDLTCLSVNDLELCVVVPERGQHFLSSDLKSGRPTSASKENKAATSVSSFRPKESGTAQGNTSATTAVSSLQPPMPTSESMSVGSTAKEPVHIKWDKPMKKPAEEESDADSLLDSDEDFEERDSHFRRNKTKWHSLSSLKGILAFKEFLSGTSGEKYWHLWIDIDKARLIHSEEDKQKYIMYMRNSYYRKGSLFELSTEDKKKLGLENLSSWCPEHLFEIHAKVLEPLVLYWAPRYLLRHLMRAHPEKYKEYNEMKAIQPPRETDPFPQTAPLLPLRPKSCCPRMSAGSGLEEKAFPPRSFRPRPPSHGTSPMVGNHRVYGEDTIRRLADTPSARYLGLRPTTAGAKQRTSSRPGTATSVTAPSADGTTPASATVATSSSRRGMARRGSTPGSMTFIEPNQEAVAAIPAVSVASPSGQRVKSEGSQRTSQSEEASGGIGSAYIGKMSGVSASASPTALMSQHSADAVPGQSSKGGKQRKTCLSRNLDHILTDRKPSERASTAPRLSMPKKPKDLLSPMLKIVDTKDARSRNSRSAPAPEMEKAANTNTFYRQDSQSSSRKCPADFASSADGAAGADGSSQAEGEAAAGAAASGGEEQPVMAVTDCDFMGSGRLEFLLQALHHESDAGRSLRKYIEKSGRQDWINNLDFWEKVQQYRKLFYKDKLDLFLISWQAKAICAQCIVEGAEKHIGVAESIELAVLERLSPAYECLFDDAEEHALKKLYEAFQLYLNQDVKTYCKVERSALTRRLETKNTYILNLQKKGIIKEGPLTPDDPMAGYVDPVCDESVLEKIPERFREWTLDKLLHNRIELEHFRLFLADNYAEVDLKCWMDIETWRRTPHEEDKKRDQRARDIKKNYLNRRYFFGPSSPAGKEGQNKVMEVGGGWGKFLEDKPHSRSILEAQKYVRERLEKKHLLWFLASPEFQARQSPKLSVADSADDVVTQKRKRTAAVLKIFKAQEERFYTMLHKKPPLKPRESELVLPPIMLKDRNKPGGGFGVQEPFRLSHSITTSCEESVLSQFIGSPKELMEAIIQKQFELDGGPPSSTRLLESRWVTSAKEINCFRQALKNPLTCELFQHYVALQGDNLENDVLFWLEVQKYKEMHHSHTEDAMLNQKIAAIINCFIESSIPPSLQIDIPPDMAERILEHKHEKGPYLFREAQLATFRILLQHWQPFVEFRNNMMTNERAMKTLERHRLLARRREQEYREALEAQRERERLQKLEDELAAAEAVDEEDKGAKYGFSYSAYLQEMMLERTKDTQTPRSGENGVEEEDDDLAELPALLGKRRESRKASKDKGGTDAGGGGSDNSDVSAGGGAAGAGSDEPVGSLRRGSSIEGKRRTSQVSGKKEKPETKQLAKDGPTNDRPLSGKGGKSSKNKTMSPGNASDIKNGPRPANEKAAKSLAGKKGGQTVPLVTVEEAE